MISVAEAADRLGVSRYRIHARLRDGSVRGQRSGRSWLVDSSSLSSARRTRPMSAGMALALAEVVDGRRPADLYASQLSRLREKSELIATKPFEEVIDLIRSWMATRASALKLEAAPVDVSALREDSRLRPSGLSDPRTDLAAAEVAEGYIARADLDAFADDHFLDLDTTHERPNIYLHVLERATDPATPVPRLLSASDLIDHGGPREVQAALRLLGRA